MEEAMEVEKAEEAAPAVVDVSDAVFEWLTTRFPDEQVEKKDVVVPKAIGFPKFSNFVSDIYIISSAMEPTDWLELFVVFQKQAKVSAEARRVNPAIATQPLDTLERAFMVPFKGSANKRFFEYIQLAWREYALGAKKFRFPYIAMVQSSGFGKSRLLKECALMCREANATNTEMARSHETNTTNSEMTRSHLLYVCVRDVKHSTGFPVRTSVLAQHFFPQDVERKSTDSLTAALSAKLVSLFEFVMHSPAAEVDEQLLKLFVRISTESDAAQEYFCEPQALPTVKPVRNDHCSRVLIVAIDEARALLPSDELESSNNIGWFRIFRRALDVANESIHDTYGLLSGVFGVVVDTNSRVSNFVPSAKRDPSLRKVKQELIPPFVLTETMDAFNNEDDEDNEGVALTVADQARRYQKSVLSQVVKMASRDKSKTLQPDSWVELLKLGRPLWGSRRTWTHNLIIEVAAVKLLGGKPTLSTLGNDYGSLASVMCRLGVRPYMSTPLASEVVADHMAVLSYVGWERDQFCVSYSSDPILTLGATKVWYSVSPGKSTNNLSSDILPKLKAVMHQELLDTGGVGEFAARIVLLLAMDACGVLETNDEKMRWLGAGEFYSVLTFLRALEGTDVAVHTRRGEDKKTLADVRAAQERWRNHFVSFTHFVQLSEEPTEACLWGLLGRRAVGVMPRGQKGADFVIPICRAAKDMEVDVKTKQGEDATPSAENSMFFPPQKRKHSDTCDMEVDVKVKQEEDAAPPAEIPICRPEATPQNQSHSDTGVAEVAAEETQENKTPPDVSMILVQVKNYKDGFSSFADEIKKKLKPAFVFSKLNPLSTTSPSDVLRVFMSLREKSDCTHTYLDTLDPKSFALCLRGLRAWSSTPDGMPNRTVEIVSPSAASSLSDMLGPWWRVSEMVKQDMKGCPPDLRIEDAGALEARAVQSLGESLVLNEPPIGVPRL